MSKEAIRLAGSDLSMGETEDNLFCPFCGVTHEQKLSITRVQGGVLYNCYRAKCGAKGFVPDYGAWEQRPSTPTVPVNRPYRGKLYPMGEKDEEFFMLQWGIEAREFGIRVTEDNRYALPLKSPKAEYRGWVLRMPSWSNVSYDVPLKFSGEGSPPKASTRKDKADDPNISWATCALPTAPVVLVEDYISACKVSLAGATGVSLSGTNLNYAGVREIKLVDPERLYIWLDPGAERAAYNIQSQWGLTFNWSSVIVGDKDPKDHTVDEIREKLSVAGW